MDEFNRFDIEISQLDSNKVKQDHIYRYVESLVTGRFHKVSKDFDPNKDLSVNKIIDADGDGIVSSTELHDFEMKQQQTIWVARINKIYNLVMGLLGGMSVMHLVFISAIKNLAMFMSTYSEFANLICTFTQVLTNFALIFGLTLTFIFKHKSDEKMRNLDQDRLEFRQQYVLGVATQFLVFLAWIILNFMPAYTNKFYYLNAQDV